MYIIIVGGGKVGYYLAQKLVEDEHVVSIIEENKELCADIAEKMDNVLVINGDGCDTKFLEQAGIERAEVVAAVTGSDQDNLIVCQLAKEIFKVKRTVGRVNDPKNAGTFNALGVDVPVDSTAIIAKIIEEEVSLEDFVTLLTFKRGRLALVRVDITEESPVVNKKVMDVTLPRDSVLVAILRGGGMVVPRGDTVLQAGDDVIAITTIENEQQLLNALIGEVGS